MPQGWARQWPKWLTLQPPGQPGLSASPLSHNGGTTLYSLHRALHALSLLQQTPGVGNTWPCLTVGKLGSDGAQLPGHRAFKELRRASLRDKIQGSLDRWRGGLQRLLGDWDLLLKKPGGCQLEEGAGHGMTRYCSGKLSPCGCGEGLPGPPELAEERRA